MDSCFHYRILIFVITTFLVIFELKADQRDPSFFPNHGCFKENYQSYESQNGSILRQASGQNIDDPYINAIWESMLSNETTYNEVSSLQRMAVNSLKSLGLWHGGYFRQTGQKPENKETSLDSENYKPDEVTPNTNKIEIYSVNSIDLYSEEKGQENFKKIAEALCQTTNGSNVLFPPIMCSLTLTNRRTFVSPFMKEFVAPISMQIANNSKPSEIGKASLQRGSEIDDTLKSVALGDNTFRYGFSRNAESLMPFIARQCGNGPFGPNGYIYDRQGRPVAFIVRVNGDSGPVAMAQPLVGKQYLSSYAHLMRTPDSERLAFHERLKKVYDLSAEILNCEI